MGEVFQRIPEGLFCSLATLLAREPQDARPDGGIPDRAIRHDTGLDREHQEYASGHGSGQGSQRALHDRAERVAAGLPE